MPPPLPSLLLPSLCGGEQSGQPPLLGPVWMAPPMTKPAVWQQQLPWRAAV